ncbi:MAG: ATP-dependent DNA helicase RecG [Erysipelotrichaceae bacterium]|nr:ATP-dependent DNA helicase RecG [Erysipelotrichaceae bacterium]
MKEIKLTPKRKEALAQLGINNTEDIINYFPYRYDRLEFLDYHQWELNSKVIVEGEVFSRPKVARFGRGKSVIHFELGNRQDVFRITVFNQPWYRNLEIGQHLTIVGKYEGGNRILATQTTKDEMKELLGIRPVYSLKDKIKPKTFSKLVSDALEANKNEITDFMPADIMRKYSFMNRYDALCNVHFPDDETALRKAIDTLKYEEFFRFQLYMLYRRQQAFNRDERYRKVFDVSRIREFADRLPYTLTDDQKRAVNDIIRDMKGNYKMGRLLQGDVGCGKTVVAFIAMYACYLAGQQSCLMAPTEILAKQHYGNMKKMFADYDVRIALLYSNISALERRELLSQIASGEIDFIIGTHALFQSDVEFRKLGLIITDEQHRFGVKQRQLLQDKGADADVLLMSATPIPRTLATSLYGDLDVTTITQTPNAAKKITTTLIRKNSFMEIVDQIEKLLDEGNQMYVVCAAIDNSSDVISRNVNDIYKNLSQYFNGRYRVGLLHGQMPEEEKDRVQNSFARHELDILVSTTVIEVGVDVRDANIMIIYDANRFGLSQLHQLRGRIGRHEREGFCYLLTDTQDEEALKRLQVIVENRDGFKISYYDLQLRGPGDILGYRQSGLPSFNIGNVVNDADLLNRSRQDVQEILNKIDDPQYAEVKKFLAKISTNEPFYMD